MVAGVTSGVLVGAGAGVGGWWGWWSGGGGGGGGGVGSFAL